MTIPTFSSLFIVAALLSGCALTPAEPTKSVDPVLSPPKTQYDASIAANNGTLLSINQLADRLADADVVVIGEYHGHHGAHLLQSLLISALYQHSMDIAVSMEQFETDTQNVVNRYLEGDIGEAELIEDARAWSNYRASYRPVVEFARQHGLPVIAANAPGDVVRCVGRTGVGYLDTVDPALRAELPPLPFTDTEAYRDKFFAAMGHGHGGTGAGGEMSERLQNSYQAQLLRDNTMAGQILDAKTRSPSRQIIHLTGTFHSESRLGLVAVLEKQRPDLKVAVLSPIAMERRQALSTLLADHGDKGDYLYFIQPLPVEYKDSQRQHDAMMAQFKGAATTSCD